MDFKTWIEADEWWGNIPWPVRPAVQERPNEKDNPPALSGRDYVVYHGTNIQNARQIFKNRTLLHDDIGVVGFTTTPSAAGVYAAMKIKRPNNPGVVLRIELDADWFLQQDISREGGGSGYDQWLIHVDKVPPQAIKRLELYSVYGTPVGRFKDIHPQ